MGSFIVGRYGSGHGASYGDQRTSRRSELGRAYAGTGSTASSSGYASASSAGTSRSTCSSVSRSRGSTNHSANSGSSKWRSGLGRTVAASGADNGKSSSGRVRGSPTVAAVATSSRGLHRVSSRRSSSLVFTSSGGSFSCGSRTCFGLGSVGRSTGRCYSAGDVHTFCFLTSVTARVSSD